MDWSRFFTTYTPFVQKKKQDNTTVSVMNPYSDLNLGTVQFTTPSFDISSDTSTWDNLSWKTTEVSNDETSDKTDDSSSDETDDNSSDDFTIEQFRQTNNLKLNDTSQEAANAFVKTFAPIIESEVRKLNTSQNLNLSEDQIMQVTKRITFQNAMESANGTSNVANANNNLGGVKYTKWQLDFGGSLGSKANDGGNYSKYPGVKAFYNMLFSRLYSKKYISAFIASSDREYINNLKKNGYFTANPNEYYAGVFNSVRRKAWDNYINDR